MPKEINEASLKNLLQNYGQKRLNEAQDLQHDIDVVDTTLEDNEETPFKKAARISKDLKNRVRRVQWNLFWVKELHDAIKQAMQNAGKQAKAFNSYNEFAAESAKNALRSQLQKLIEVLEPPEEMLQSEEFQAILRMLWPKDLSKNLNQSNFDKQQHHSSKHINKKSAFNAAFKEAAHLAQEKLLKDPTKLNTKRLNGKALEQMMAMDLDHMSRFIKRKMKALKKKRLKNGTLVDEDEESSLFNTENPNINADELDDIEDLQDLITILNARALATMQALREQIAPKWSPEEQPWLIGNSDKQVYDIILATIPKALFEQTEHFDSLQNLRQGDNVFIFRAKDKLNAYAAKS